MTGILIAGCGDVGSTLGVLLAQAGHTVWGLRRDVAKLPPILSPIAADLTDIATLDNLPPNIRHVIYTAAAAGRDDAAYRAAYVDGPRNLITALHRAGQPIERFVFTSSTGVYGQTDGGWVDESSPTEPTSFTGQRVLEGEGVVHAASWTSIVVRLAGIYGPGRTRLLERARTGAPVARDAPSYTNRIHRDDCAGALAHVLALPTPAPCYVGVDDEPAPLGRVVDWICEQAGWPRPPDAAAAVGPDMPPSRRGGNKRCRNQRLRDTGYTFRYPTFREGYATLLATDGAITNSSARPGDSQ